jgi:putative transposase
MRDIYHRRSIRLKNYDYSQTGYYFVTICTRNRECILGNVVDGEMQLSKIGQLVQIAWNDLLKRFENFELDKVTVMPNHIHGIITIVEAGLALPKEGAASSAPTRDVPIRLMDVVRAFKSISAINVNRFLSRVGIPLWQPNYYEHIIRNEESLNRVREYIGNNPLRWELDRENPQRKGEDEFDLWLAKFKRRPNKKG